MGKAEKSFEQFEVELTLLVDRFLKNFSQYKGPDYNEARLRDDFLNPLFAALGWDISNRAGLIQSKREVEIESATRIGSARKRADYLFRANGRDRFVCEAKKPREELGKAHVFQVKRYAWNKDLPFAVLTDFEEIKFFIVGSRPNSEEPAVGELKTLHYSDYTKNARLLWDHLSHESIAGGFIDRLIDDLPKKAAGKGRMRQGYLIKPDRNRALDIDFLNFLDDARKELASSLVKHNDRETLLSDGCLNAATQKILDRILFLRICEDRDIDTGVKLESLVDTWERHTTRPLPERRFRFLDEPPQSGSRTANESLYRRIVRHFRELDRRPPSTVPFFNGQLFKKDPSEDLEVGDDFLINFIRDLSDENSPYLFNVIPVEILGSVYERFLGKVVRPHGRGVAVEEKPEVRKAGGVYYTPRYIVDYIVEQTVGKLLDEVATKKDLKTFSSRTDALRFLDPACGSGSFLIRAFERTCEHWEKRLTDDLPPKEDKADRSAWVRKYRRLCWVDPESSTVHLTVDLKRQILTQNIYGVDLDAAAVEVTQLSLYLKMLENENRTTLQHQRELLADESDIALLPPLQDNIKCGNSLIASDFSMIAEDLVRVNAFDWRVQFEQIGKAGGFDAVIGNPPYGASLDDQSKKYIARKFESYCYKYDSYIYFVEQAIRLIKTGGFASFITPELWLKLESAKMLRKFIRDKAEVVSLLICGENVFEEAVVNTVVFVLRRGFKTKQIEIIQADRRWFMSEGVWASSDLLAIDYRLLPEIREIMRHFKASNISPLSSFGDAIQGITPYDKYRGQSAETIKTRGYHFESKIDKTCGKWMAGQDIDRYFSSWSGEWLSYGPWLAAPRDPRYFTGPRLLFREIPGNQRRIQATFIAKETYFHGHSITPFKPNDAKANVSILYLLGLSNSKLLSWYGGLVLPNFGKTIFPKLNPQDIKALPIRQIDFSNPSDKSLHDKLVALVEKMLALMPGLKDATSEREKTALQNAVSATDYKIDELVYELYGLTSEEIAFVESVR